MDVLGAFVRVAAGRYVAGFVLVRGERIVDSWSVTAPADVDEGIQLGELHQWTADLIDEHAPDAVSLKGTEAGSGKAQTVAQHGQGAILAAAGRAGTPTRVWTGSGYRAAVGVSSNAAAISRARADLDGAWPAADETRQAAGAALAMIRRPSK